MWSLKRPLSNGSFIRIYFLGSFSIIDIFLTETSGGVEKNIGLNNRFFHWRISFPRGVRRCHVYFGSIFFLLLSTFFFRFLPCFHLGRMIYSRYVPRILLVSSSKRFAIKDIVLVIAQRRIVSLTNSRLDECDRLKHFVIRDVTCRV